MNSDRSSKLIFLLFPINREIYRVFPSDASKRWPNDSSKAEPYEPITKDFPRSQSREIPVGMQERLANQQGFRSQFEKLRPEQKSRGGLILENFGDDRHILACG
jgi:hypothetical protein